MNDEFIKIKKEMSTEAAFKIKKEQNHSEPVFEYIDKIKRGKIPSQSNEQSNTVAIKQEPDKSSVQEKKIESFALEKKKLLKEIVTLRKEHQQTFLQLQKCNRQQDEIKYEFNLREKSFTEKSIKFNNNIKNLEAEKNVMENTAKKNEKTIEHLTDQLKKEIKKSNGLSRQNNILNARLKQMSTTVVTDDGQANSDVFEAERIVDHKRNGSKRIFRIRWKGFGAKDDTWEPEENLFCPSIMKEYLQDHLF